MGIYHSLCMCMYLSLSFSVCVCQMGGGGGGVVQELVEAEAEAEIRELVREKEQLQDSQRRQQEERERLAREREEMGATWGMGERSHYSTFTMFHSSFNVLWCSSDMCTYKHHCRRFGGVSKFTPRSLSLLLVYAF